MPTQSPPRITMLPLPPAPPPDNETLRILLVEDDVALLELLKGWLQDETPHEVLTAANGQEALDLLQHQPAQLIITDWVMAKVDGLELVQQVRAMPFPDYVYILLLTSRGGKRDLVKALECGADDYLTKPFDLAELQARLIAGERRLRRERALRVARDEAMLHSRHDSLTGVLSRRAIIAEGEAALATARREGKSASVIMLDVDYLKQVNDEHGHLIGDELLRLMAATVSEALRMGDAMGRWGGDEFLLILPDTPLPGAIAVAERLRALVDATSLNLSEGGTVSLHACLGVAASEPGNYPTLLHLIERADRALYRAKKGGRNQVEAWAGRQEEEGRGRRGVADPADG